jgi:hypothetical protein
VSDAETERRSRLVGLKLRALVRDHLADDTLPDPVAFAPGAALRHRDAAWVYLDERPGSMLGAALAWMLRSGASSLHVVADRETGVLARRAREFRCPIEVWHAADRSLLPAVPEPGAPPASVPAHHDRFRELIEAGGAVPSAEHGVLYGDVRGLEVCRVVDDPHLGTTRLEVGVGAHDREAFQMLHGDEPAVESLARIVRAVAEHRRLGAPRHPLNRLAAERFLRWRIEQEPTLVGATSIGPAEPPIRRENLKDAVPCVASGTGDDGRPIIVVCATGVDLDLVPYAADARLAVAGPGVGAGGPRLVLATPSRDQVRVTGELAGLLRHSSELVSID